MRVNSEEAIRRGRAARDKAGSWIEMRRTTPIGRFSDPDMACDAVRRQAHPPGQDDQ